MDRRRLRPDPPAGGVLSPADTFGRADSASTLGAAESGHPWGALTGTWGISSARGYCVSNGDLHLAAVDWAHGDCEVTARLAAIPAWCIPGVAARCSDASNYVAAGCDGPQTYLFKVVGGSLTWVLASGGGAYSAGDTIGLRCVGTAYSVLRNGVVVLGPTTDSSFTSGGKVGLIQRQFGSGTALWDDFTAVAL